MALNLEIKRLHIEASGQWSGGADQFRVMLEEALQEELRRALLTGPIDAHQILRMDLPPITAEDAYDMREIACEIARRIVQAIRRNSQ